MSHRMTQRTTHRSVTIATLLAAASLALAGCSSAAPSSPADSAAPPVSESQAPAETTAASESSSGLESESPSEPAAAGSTALLAVVGTEEDPEAYEIALTDETGSPVTTLPAGDYSLTFVDRSTMHNFHMTGPGDVDVSTDVRGSDESTIEVTLVEGTYEYVCDPHVPSMNGSLDVTG